MLYPNKTGNLFQYLMPDCTWQVKTSKKEIFLTFDDGPIPDVTEWVLDILNQYNIKATFFCVGDNIAKHPEIFKQVLANGHSIGNHTFNHIKGWQTDNTEYYQNIQKWEDTISELGLTLNNKPLFRPPYGRISFRQVKYLKQYYEIVMWSIITGDFHKSLHAENCLDRSLKMTNNGTVIVFHDSIKSEQNIKAILPRYIENALKAGFAFSRMGGFN